LSVDLLSAIFKLKRTAAALHGFLATALLSCYYLLDDRRDSGSFWHTTSRATTFARRLVFDSSDVMSVVILKSRRHVNDDSLLSVMFCVAELILELDVEMDSDWSRWTLQELE